MTSSGNSNPAVIFDDQVTSLVREALDLVQIAVGHDEVGDYVFACDYYDNTVLHLDEALNKLDISNAEYKSILQLRSKYAARLDLLRAHEAGKRDLNLLGGATPSTKGPGQGAKQRRMSRQPFDEEMDPVPHHQDPPSSSITLIRQPYNVLRIIRSTIETGAFLPCQSKSARNVHGSVYIPPIIWKQFGVKLSGLSAKTTAFESVIELIEVKLENLCFPDGDLDTLIAAKDHFEVFIGAIQVIQNSLSKPFPFISEIVAAPIDSPDAQPNSGGGQTSAKDGKNWSNFVAGYAKTVVKYAETGYQRLGAMTTRVSDDDFAAYGTLILILCEKCQLLDRWQEYLEKERERVLHGAAGAPNPKAPSVSSRLFGAVSDGDHDTEGVPDPPEIPKAVTRGRLNTVDLTPDQSSWLAALECLLVDMMSVSRFIREVVCEIILRDVETLTARYMKKMRKSFSKMHWDDEGENYEADAS